MGFERVKSGDCVQADFGDPGSVEFSFEKGKRMPQKQA